MGPFAGMGIPFSVHWAVYGFFTDSWAIVFRKQGSGPAVGNPRSGIYLILMVEVSQITPPVGFNLFVIQGLTGDPIMRIARHALPFFFLMLLTTTVITIFPEIVLYLPKLMVGSLGQCSSQYSYGKR